MPTYDFINTETGEEFEDLMSISSLEKFLKDNPHIRQKISRPMIVSDVGDQIKVDDGFREAVSRVKETYKINNIKSY
jgi:hypothetical protein